MHIIRHYDHCPDYAKHSVIALGNFDGVHKGHQAVIETSLKIAKETGKPSAVMTFEPHPLALLRPHEPLLRITPFAQKARILKALKVDLLFALPFNHNLSRITGVDFITDILAKYLKVSHVVIGYDFIFGHKRSGNADLLKELSSAHHFGFTQVQAVAGEGTTFSSTLIRQYIQEGNVLAANKMLGRAFTIEGRVQHGEKRGRQLGFPTANIALSSTSLLPKRGVYTVRTSLKESPNVIHYGIANLGKKPTFGTYNDTLEIHLFDFNQDIYGKQLVVALLDFIRPEQTFSGIESLKKQIEADIVQARSIVEPLK